MRAYPKKGALRAANHVRLMRILGDVSAHRPDVVVTPECYLDGYVSTEAEVSKGNIVEYAIDPLSLALCPGGVRVGLPQQRVGHLRLHEARPGRRIQHRPDLR